MKIKQKYPNMDRAAMIAISYSDIVNEQLSKDAILNNEFPGFKEDYLVLHCLLKRYPVTRFLEIGTNMGMGTLIIKNALGDLAHVYSLDLPPEKAHISLQHPISEGKTDSIGYKCYMHYTQVFADSRDFDYSRLYPIDGSYIDGEHVRENVYHESKEMIKAGCKIIIYHDSDIAEVYNAIVDAHAYSGYILNRVINTRIAYAICGDQYSL